MHTLGIEIILFDVNTELARCTFAPGIDLALIIES